MTGSLRSHLRRPPHQPGPHPAPPQALPASAWLPRVWAGWASGRPPHAHDSDARVGAMSWPPPPAAPTQPASPKRAGTSASRPGRHEALTPGAVAPALAAGGRGRGGRRGRRGPHLLRRQPAQPAGRCGGGAGGGARRSWGSGGVVFRPASHIGPPAPRGGPRGGAWIVHWSRMGRARSRAGPAGRRRRSPARRPPTHAPTAAPTVAGSALLLGGHGALQRGLPRWGTMRPISVQALKPSDT